MNSPGMVRRVTDNVYVFWALLALPGIYMFVQRLSGGKMAYVPLSGEISAWLLIVTMMITPLMLLIGPLPWLKARRRHLGVASFSYAMLHLLFWLVNVNLGQFIKSFFRFEILTGWIALALMVVLAVTSTDGWVRSLGPRWKKMQRWVYAAAALTLVHWLMTTEHRIEALLYCAPLILLSVWRVARYRARSRSA